MSIGSLRAAVGPRVRVSPFLPSTLEDGLTSVSTYNHMWLPMGYGDPEAEYRRLTRAVAMWDVAAQRHIEVRGPGADELAQVATVIDVSAIVAGHGAYAPMLDHGGRLINDPVLLRMDDGTWRFSIADADIRLWLAALAAERDIDAEVTELPTATLAVQGPRAWDVASDLGLPHLADTPRFRHVAAGIDAIEVRIGHSGWSAQGGFELFLDDADQAVHLWSVVRRAGRRHGIGPGAPNPSERIENFLLSYGTDTGYDAHPDEAALGDLVDVEHGGDFVGRTALCDARRRGLSRHLLGVDIDGAPIGTLTHPVDVTVDGEVIGQLRAAAHSPRFDTNLGLALVDRRHDVGTSGDVTLPDGRRNARLVALPFDH